MPIIYRQHPQSTLHIDSDSETLTPPTPDPDDAIVLSDLVRTGEASRLRRRGAMRLDHGYPSQQQNNPTQGPSYSNIIVVGSPAWDSEPEEIQPSPYPRDRVRDRARPRRNATNEEESNYNYTIFCGGEDKVEDDHLNQPCSFRPSPLPLYPSSPSHSRRISKSPVKTRNNGCGAVLHVAAAPVKRQHAWQASTGATDAIIELHPKYFDKNIASKIVRSGCGCFREGIACALCGNPIGTRYRGCQTSDNDHGHPRHKPPSPLHPEGPRYWRAHDHRPNLETYIYTFIASQVSSSPGYHFPSMYRNSPSPNTPSGSITRGSFSNLSPNRPLDDPGFGSSLDAGGPRMQNPGGGLPPPPSSMMFGDRIMTASPVPMSDLGDEDTEYPYRSLRTPPPLPPLPMATAFRYDDYSDGDGEPGSPDKIDGPMLFPER